MYFNKIYKLLYVKGCSKMIISQLKNREVRASLSILLGFVLGVFYVTANIILCMFYSAVWYLALALYNSSLILCRYYAFELYQRPEVIGKISSILRFASVFMSLAVLYSTLSGEFRVKSTLALIVSGIYTAFSFFRVIFGLIFDKKRSLPIFSVLERLRLLSFASSFHALFLQLIYMLGVDTKTKTASALASAFLSSALILIATPKKEQKI